MLAMHKICAPLLGIFLFTSVQVGAETPDWSRTLERISTGVVSLKIDATRAFDTGSNASSQATGFVVDAEQGLILTNRHVVTPGPVRAKALFLNQEEVALTPVYRDPVHDFGLFRYDPAALRYIEPAELPLNPAGAAVGVEVRIVGNDAGEQLSILSGTLARLDRRTPNYGFANYNDFNTFYIQAATGSSGGSSGSPVIDIRGHVVALNAGASAKAASSYFLPLDRVKRAVDLLRAGEPVSRGTLETKFARVAFDELQRLGLSEMTEAEYREAFPAQTGMLVVTDIMPGGAADNVLEVGDVLLAVDGERLAEFVPLSDALDAHVGGAVKLTLERRGRRLKVELNVTDLHAITPDEYIDFSGGVFHDLSYQQAWHLNKPQTGVYVASQGFALRTAGIPRRSVIVEMNGQPVTGLDDMERILAGLADREEIAVRLFPFEDPNGVVLRLIKTDRRWFAIDRCVRDDTTGLWPCRSLDSGPEPVPPEPASTDFPSVADRMQQRIAASLVLVNFDMPYTISGIGDQHYYGTGLVVDAERGYVVVDRNTVPEALGDVSLTFAGSIEIEGRVEYVHPLHNLALLSYDPELIGSTPVRSANLEVSERQPGDKLLAVGLRPDSVLMSQDVQVAGISPVYFPLSRSIRYRESNLEAISLITPPKDIDGVLTDERGRVVALWSSFAYEAGGESYQENMGMPAELVAEMLDVVRNDKKLRSLEAEFHHMPLSLARDYGLPDEWIKKLEAHDPGRRQLLSVVRTVAGTPTATSLQPGDLLLSIDGDPVTRFREVETAVQQDRVSVAVWRNQRVENFDIPTTELDGRGVRRVLIWAGALLQEPYREMAAQRSIDTDGVYVAYYSFGTPVSRAGLGAGSRIISVDGQPVAGLDEFIELVRDRRDQESIRITTMTWNGGVQVFSITLDTVYWPAAELVYNGDWHRVPLQPRDTAQRTD
jgi:S1-C subfamily serine protease